MIFNLQSLIREPLPGMPEELVKEHTAHYAGVLRKYGYDDRHKKSFSVLAEYMARYNAAQTSKDEYPPYERPRRGLFIYGDKGVGKTLFLKIFSGIFNIEIIPADVLIRNYERGSGARFWAIAEELNRQSLIIDDICNEREIRSFGNESPMADFIVDRFRQWEDNRTYTFFTSNIRNRDELNGRYGGPIMSRVLGMCDFIEITGKDRRLER